MEWNREPRNTPCLSGQLVFDRESKNIAWGKENLFNKWCQKIEQICANKKKEARAPSYIIQKIYSNRLNT